MANSDGRQNPKKVGKWFWNKDGITDEGRNFIRELNDAAPGIKKVRYEEHGPYIYAVKINQLKINIETAADIEEMTLIKVGFTHMDTSKENKDSRINKLMEEIQRKIKENWKIEVSCGVVFVLSIDALNARGFFDIEAEVRNKVGIAVPKNIGKALYLPVHTEWVVTTTKFISSIRERIDSLKIRTPAKQQKMQPKQEQNPEAKESNSTPSKTQESSGLPSGATSMMSGERTPIAASPKQETTTDVDDLTKSMQDVKLNQSIQDPADPLSNRTPTKQQKQEQSPGAKESILTSSKKQESSGTPSGASKIVAGESTPSSVPPKQKQSVTIDTEAIFGKDGLKFDAKDSGVSAAFDVIKAYKENEVDVELGTKDDNSFLKVRKAKKVKSG